MTRLALVYAAGTLGGLANSLALWLFGYYGFNETLEVDIHPELTAAWLYPRLVWGGLWGLLFLPRVLVNNVVQRAFLLSLGPTLVQLLIVFPHKLGLGYGGVELGQLTPAVVVVANLIWALITALSLRMMRR